MSYQFKPSWIVNSFFFILILLLISLGTWQLNRADAKQSIQHMIDQRSSLEPLSLNMPFEEFSPYQVVRATGQYRSKDSILLDNIIYNEQPGYHLITPFEIMASRTIILVNRGWIPQKENNADLPSFKTPSGLITIEGHLSHPQSKPDLLQDASPPLSPTPLLWQYLDQDFFSQLNGYPVLPLVLKLKPAGQINTFSSLNIPRIDTETALIQDWPSYRSESEIHLGFSILWFIFALLGLAVYIGLSFKKINNN